MTGQEALATIAEIALGLIGFTGIVIVFGHKPGRLTGVEAYRVANLLAVSSPPLFLALLPFGLYHLGLAEKTLWPLASGIMALYTAILLAGFAAPTRRYLVEYPEIFNRGILVALVLLHLTNLAVQAFAALGAFGDRTVGVYLMGLILFLAHGVLQFGRLLFVRSRLHEEL